jgi:hypothetical protein
VRLPDAVHVHRRNLPRSNVKFAIQRIGQVDVPAALGRLQIPISIALVGGSVGLVGDRLKFDELLEAAEGSCRCRPTEAATFRRPVEVRACRWMPN